jgi:hypothetical protein
MNTPSRIRRSLVGIVSLIFCLAGSSPSFSQETQAIPRPGRLKRLFDGKDFKGFDTLLQKHGINSDPDQVFRAENGLLHISGEEFGGLVTKREYADYYLRAEFRWGEKMYPPRLGRSRDSGIQYNITGPLKVWARMMEFQINEGGTGATVNGTRYQSASEPSRKQYIRIAHVGRGPLVNETGYRDPVNELERPHGEWNQLELVVDHDRILDDRSRCRRSVRARDDARTAARRHRQG